MGYGISKIVINLLIRNEWDYSGFKMGGRYQISGNTHITELLSFTHGQSDNLINLKRLGLCLAFQLR